MLELKQVIDENQIWKYFQDPPNPLNRTLYPKHIDFFKAGSTAMERCALSANRGGKSVMGAYETVCHATGIYPVWWEGRRFERPTVSWSCAESYKKSFEINQQKLLGKVGAWGTGLLPKKSIVRTSKNGDIVQILYVKHISGGISTITFKSYDQGIEAFQGNEVDFIWGDEEMPNSIYGECIIRVTSTVPGKPSGIVSLTYTPVSGLSELSKSFAPNGKPLTGYLPDGKYVTNITWEDIPHIDQKEKDKIEAATPPFMRAARMRGEPALGAGRIYPIDEAQIRVGRFAIPDTWQKAFAVDAGYNHPAIAWFAKDPATSTIYLYKVWKSDQQLPTMVANIIKQEGDWIRGVCDPAAPGLIAELHTHGVKSIGADNEVATGLSVTWEALNTGKLKVFSDCEQWFEEFRLYARKENGQINKVNDHLMDATRYFMMSGSHQFLVKPPPEKKVVKNIPRPAHWMGV